MVGLPKRKVSFFFSHTSVEAATAAAAVTEVAAVVVTEGVTAAVVEVSKRRCECGVKLGYFSKMLG